jgi:glucosamine 6-phosphate synthetase-like amidotransferase/phosphosugar isomerase protein
MCCLFGVLDCRQNLSAKQLNKMVAVLSKACEARGTDATGIAYNYNDRMCIFKRPLPAHRMRYAIPNGVHYVMGHTRMTTQGDEKFNYNNHPFLGKTENTDFALAHNGVLYNDEVLRYTESLPKTHIETDSFVAVQLIEKRKTLSTSGLKYMAEKLEGSFTITVMDKKDNLYFVKGDNPMSIFHFKDIGLYIYASTEEILLKAIGRMQTKLGRYEKVDITCGDILTIDRFGNRTKTTFETDNLYAFNYRSCFRWTSIPRSSTVTDKKIDEQTEYLNLLKTEAEYCGYSPSLIDTLIADGFSIDDIEEMIYCGAY